MSDLSIQVESGNDLIFVNKPAGLSTHAPDPDKLGLAEILQDRLGRKLYVVHRLDKTTTGCIVFALTQSKANDLFEKFKAHQVQKKYLLLTNRHVDFSEIQIQSEIQKQDKKFLNNPQATNPNAQTFFKRIKGNALFNLWEATPQTGKPHQIRIHAQQAGIPILGDPLYGGSPYPHLCLHASELEIPGEKKFTCSAPLFFDRMGLIRDIPLAQILSALDRRQRLFDFLNKPQQCLRLSHQENLDFRIDLYGPVLWVYWYKDQEPSASNLERFEFTAGVLKKKWVLRKMQNRGENPNLRQGTEFELPFWQAEENQLKYQLRSEQGLSPGLFLDQRRNRQWVYKNSSGLSVLNLYSYTCGFSLAAAAGGAKEVVSVDLSAKFLEWGKVNFTMNNLDPQAYQFFAQDSFKFLAKTKKMQRLFDIIICDPPSFSRHDKNIFKIEKDFSRLIQDVYSLLKSRGTLLFSTNFEKWSAFDIKKKIAQELNIPLQKIRDGMQDYDFELPQEPPLMKSFFISKD